MGSFGSGFFQAIGNAVKQKSDQAAADEQQKRHDEAAVHLAALQSGTLTPDQQQAAWTAYQKVYGHSKGLKDAIPKIQQLVGKLSGHPQWGAQNTDGQQPAATPGQSAATPPAAPAPQQSSQVPFASLGITPPPGQAPAAAPTPPAAPALPTSALASPLPAGDGKSAPDTSAADPQAPSAGPVPPPPSARTMATDSTDPAKVGASQLPPDAMAGAPSAPAQGRPPSSPPAVPSGGIQQWELGAAFPDPNVVKQKADEAAWVIEKRKLDLQHQYKIEEEVTAARAKADNPTGRPVGGPQLSVQNARDLMKQGGGAYMDEDGDPLDVNSLPDNMGLKVFFQGSKRFYVPFSPNDKVINIGGISYAVDPMDVAGVTAGRGTPLGLQHPPTSTSSIAPLTVEQDGKTIQLPGSHSVTPLPTGAFGTPPPSAGSSPRTPVPTGVPVPPAAHASVQVQHAAAPKTVRDQPATASPGIPAGGRVLPRGAVPLGQANQQSKMYSAVMDPYVQLFGDPDVPGIPPIAKYAALADNKEASNRIGAAINLSMQGLDEEGDKGGGILKIFSNQGGLPSLEASSHAKAINDSIQALTPTEREAYDRQMNMIGTLVGMRAITGGSAGRWSVNNIKNEAPLFGINVADSKEFNRRLASFAQQMYTASAKAPIFTDADRNRFKSEAQHLAQMGYGGSKTSAVPAPPNGASQKTYKQYAKAGNGHRIGSDDGDTWYDVKTGQKVQ